MHVIERESERESKQYIIPFFLSFNNNNNNNNNENGDINQ